MPVDSQYVSNFCILNFNEFSDHSPIMISLLSKHSVQQTLNNLVQDSRSKTKLFYDEAKVFILRNQLNIDLSFYCGVFGYWPSPFYNDLGVSGLITQN